MIIDELFEGPQLCPECGGPSFSSLILAEKKDACYHKVKASAKVWPSAYASGRLVQCRKKGAANYGKSKTEGVAEGSGQKPTITYKDYTLQYDYQTEDDDPEGYSTATTYYFDVFKDGNRVGEAEYFDYFGDLTIRINGKTKKFEHQHPLASQVSQLVSSLPDEQKRDLSDPKFESQGVAEGAKEDMSKEAKAMASGKCPHCHGPVEKKEHPTLTQYHCAKCGIRASIDKQGVAEGWSQKYKSSINCANPRGFSQKAHCAGREKNEDVAEAESEAAAQRKQYPSYYQHKDAGTVFRTQNDAGQVMNITPDDEEWDDYYKREFPDMPTPKDGGFWNDDNTAAMVEDTNTVNVPKGQEAKTQPDGSTRISKLGSMSRADYAKNMAAYKAQTQTPEKIADFKQRMASGQGYTDAERSANYQQQKKSFGDYADTPLDEQGMTEVSLGDYRKKAQVSQAGAKINKFFDRDNPEKVAAADRTIAKRERGLGRADARSRPYAAPSVDKEKQRQQLTDKYPNIDQLVSDAEKNRDPYYDRAEGNAYYAGREAEQNYVRLKQIQRIIQGLNEETRQATLNTPAGDFTVDITKDKSTNTVSGKGNVRGVNIGAVKDMTPGGSQSISADMDVAPGLNISATRKSADYNKGQLGGTKSVTAKYTDTAGALGQPGQQHTATRTTGIGFGGASGPRVGKNYVDQFDKTLADYMKEAKGINSIRNPYDLQPLEGPAGGGGGGGSTRSGPSPFGPKPGSREASIAQPNANTMTIKQTTNPDYVPPKTLQQKYDDLNKKLDQLPPALPARAPRPGRAAADQRRLDQAQASELKDVVPLSPAERNQLRPVDADKLRRSDLDRRLDLDNVRPGIDEQSSKKREQPEVEYDDEYDAMVARVKKLAGLGPMKTVYDPKKRQYRNMPTAQQPKK